MIPRLILALAAAALIASGPPPTPAADGVPAEAVRRAGDRYPQPVRVGDLLGRDVLGPVEAQPLLGRVRDIVRQPNGALALVLSHGGVLGFGTRLVSVPLEATALLGEHVALVGLTAAELGALPTTTPSGAGLSPDQVIRMGLVRPFH